MVEAVAVAQNESLNPVDQPIGRLNGEVINEIPQDLYIPPHALLVFLEAFEGPLDLLLYLIRRNNIDILDIPIVDITRQYVEYIELMQNLRLELAAEYLLMAANLAEIKSRMLLPRRHDEEGEEAGDPRADLIRRLQEYERFKQAAQDLDQLPRMLRDNFQVAADPHPEMDYVRPLPDVVLKELLIAMQDVLRREKLEESHEVTRETLSVRERMTYILSCIKGDMFIEFSQLFDYKEGRMGVVVTFIAILELLKQSMIELIQNEAFSPIHLKAVTND